MLKKSLLHSSKDNFDHDLYINDGLMMFNYILDSDIPMALKQLLQSIMLLLCASLFNRKCHRTL